MNKTNQTNQKNQKTGLAVLVSLFTSTGSRPLKAECFLHAKRVSFETEERVKTTCPHQE